MLPFRVTLIILLEVCAGGLIILVLIIRQSKKIQGVLSLFRAFEHLRHILKGCRRLSISFLFKCSFREIQAIVSIIAFEYTLILATGSQGDGCEQH